MDEKSTETCGFHPDVDCRVIVIDVVLAHKANKSSAHHAGGTIMKHVILGTISACLFATLSTTTHAALIDRGGGMIYDTDLDVTWFYDARSGYGSANDLSDGTQDGAMTWQNALYWVANLAIYDSVRDVTWDDWRLPTTLQPDPACANHYGNNSFGYNCTGSEMGHLFYDELGGVSGQNIAVVHNSNYNLFNLLIYGGYWTDTSVATDNNYSWLFDFHTGEQYGYQKTYSKYVLAVRDGDVASSSVVPVPAAAWLFGSGLMGLVGAARHRQRSSAYIV